MLGLLDFRVLFLLILLFLVLIILVQRLLPLLEVGRQHYEQPMPTSKLVRMLRYTRHDVYFEANNRLFSLSRELAAETNPATSRITPITRPLPSS